MKKIERKRALLRGLTTDYDTTVQSVMIVSSSSQNEVVMLIVSEMKIKYTQKISVTAITTRDAEDEKRYRNCQRCGEIEHIAKF